MKLFYHATTPAGYSKATSEPDARDFFQD